MVTKRPQSPIYATVSNRTATVLLGENIDGRPVVGISLPASASSVNLSAHSDPIVLRDLAADLLAGAQYLEDEREKAGL